MNTCVVTLLHYCFKTKGFKKLPVFWIPCVGFGLFMECPMALRNVISDRFMNFGNLLFMQMQNPHTRQIGNFA